MRVSNAALLAVLTLVSRLTSTSAGRYSDTTTETTYFPSEGFSTGLCLNDLYQAYHPESTLTCTGNKFWKTISLKAPPSCVEGQRLTVEELSFESEFVNDAYDFAVSLHL